MLVKGSFYFAHRTREWTEWERKKERKKERKRDWDWDRDKDTKRRKWIISMPVYLQSCSNFLFLFFCCRCCTLARALYNCRICNCFSLLLLLLLVLLFILVHNILFRFRVVAVVSVVRWETAFECEMSPYCSIHHAFTRFCFVFVLENLQLYVQYVRNHGSCAERFCMLFFYFLVVVVYASIRLSECVCVCER